MRRMGNKHPTGLNFSFSKTIILSLFIFPGVYPKTSSEDDRKFAAKSEYIQRLISKRTESYEEEEKALRVMMVEEEEEKEKQQEQERLQQKALLNLTKGLS